MQMLKTITICIGSTHYNKALSPYIWLKSLGQSLQGLGKLE